MKRLLAACVLALVGAAAAPGQKPNYRIADLQITEPVKDPANYISEAGLDCRGSDAVIVYTRHRGFRHTDDGAIVYVASRDGGRTWDAASQTVAMAPRDKWGFTSPACLILKNGTILAFALANTAVGERAGSEARFRGGYTVRSTDRGRTWTAPEPIDAWPMRGAAVWDNPTELPDGKLVLPVYGTIDEARVVGTYREPSRASLLWSDDQGLSWYMYGTIAYDPSGVRHFYEPGVALTRDSRLVALSRERLGVFGNNPPGGYLYFSESSDGGATWTPHHRTDVWGYPADLVTLKDGGILSVYGHRKDPMSVKVVVAEDGRNWLERNASVLYTAPNYDAQGPGPSNKGAIDTGYRHIGYPSACVLDDGSVLSVFHSFDAARKQILLLARFKMVRN